MNNSNEYEPWIGVDLDKTLAYANDSYEPDAIGEPVPEMLARVQDWLKNGHKVKLFTARASEPSNIPAIEKWLNKHGLKDLEVTNEKDPGLVQLWDDKAVGVVPNSGARATQVLFTP